MLLLLLLVAWNGLVFWNKHGLLLQILRRQVSGVLGLRRRRRLLARMEAILVLVVHVLAFVCSSGLRSV